MGNENEIKDFRETKKVEEIIEAAEKDSLHDSPTRGPDVPAADAVPLPVQKRSPFLPEEIHDLDSTSQVYSLEEEYARTRKNRNYRLYLFILGFITFVVICVLGFKLYREWRDSIVDVSITEFEDLRLKDVIDSARKRGSNIDVFRIELKVLEAEMLTAMLGVRRESYAREMAVLSQGLGDAETDAKIAAIRREEEARLKSVRASYNGLMARKRSQIYAQEEERAKEEEELAKQGAAARSSNTDRLYELHMKRLQDRQETGVDALKKYYDGYMDYVIMKYNPVFAQPAAGITGGSGPALTAGGALREYDPLLDEYGFSPSDFGSLRKRIGDETIVLKRLMRVPYQNSVPQALKALDVLTGTIVRDYEDLWSRLTGALASKNQLIKQYEYPLDFVLSAKKENGLILDPRENDSILVYMNRSLKIEDGRTASVYNGDRYVGRIRLYRDLRGTYRGSVVSLANKNAVIRPTNRVMLDAKK